MLKYITLALYYAHTDYVSAIHTMEIELFVFHDKSLRK